MDSAYRCPYDGFRMTEIGAETMLRVTFRTYECHNCGHQGIETSFEGEIVGHRSLLGCDCDGCKKERARTGNIILKE